ncbi:hypothetical protein ACS3SW_09885 [Roseobacteraceae bacterium S113]
MVHRWLTLLLITLLLAPLAPATSAQQSDDPETLDLIIARSAEAVELFISTRSDNFVTRFGLDPALLAEPDGTVNFDDLRLGTFDTADVMFEGVSARVDGAPAPLEAMSMMVHPIDAKLPFETHVDGLIAIAVCTVPTPTTPPTLDVLWGYAGFITYVDNSAGALSLSLPAFGGAPLKVTIRDYDTTGVLTRYEQVLTSGETIEIPASPAARASVLWSAIGLLALLSGGAVVLVLSRRGRTLAGQPAQ